MKKYLYVFVAVALSFAGCKEKDAPTMAVEDINTYATISGYVFYESPVSVKMDGSLNLDTIGLAGQVIEVKVNGSQYSSKASSVTYTYTATIDKSGKFTLNIPVLETSSSLSISSYAIRPFYMQNYPKAEYYYNPYTYSYSYEIEKCKVFYNGSLSLSIPYSVQPNTQYYCGEQVISHSNFEKVGL